MSTELSYLDDSEIYESTAKVESLTTSDDGTVSIVLDRTIFYPQGGGQPTDHGEIETSDGTANITRVSFMDGIVFHAGEIVNGTISPNTHATLRIDENRRRLHARLHTGGHVIMTAVDSMLRLPAIKGYHFPDGPYVEFSGTVTPERRESLASDIQQEVDRLVAEDFIVTARFDSVDNLRAANVYIPAEIPAGKPTRVVVTAGYQSPCGGTHVKSLGELKGLSVKGVKAKSGKTRVSYYFS
jgi:Ser-tRNA(Ala) deacylase AlaX